MLTQSDILREPNRETFASRRKKFGLSVSEMAELMGCSERHIYDLEKLPDSCQICDKKVSRVNLLFYEDILGKIEGLKTANIS